MKYAIKNLSIGFECPIFDLKNKNWNDEINTHLINNDFNFFDILKNDLELLEMKNGNYLLLYTLIVLIDNGLVTSRQVNKEWEKLEKSISTSITNYLSKQDIICFRKLTQLGG